MIVVPMAGLSSRFSRIGYLTPKFALPLAGSVVFDWALRSFERVWESQELLLVIKNSPGVREFVETRISHLKVPRARIAVLDSNTRGQAETVLLGLEQVAAPDIEPVSIFNIDTFRPGFQYPQEFDVGNSFLETFSAAGDNWSFVEALSPGSNLVRRVEEKVRISDNCCTGLYHFSSAATFRDAFFRELEVGSRKELYVAPLFNFLVADKRPVYFTVVPTDEVLVCGTPAEYQQLLHRADRWWTRYSP